MCVGVRTPHVITPVIHRNNILEQAQARVGGVPEATDRHLWLQLSIIQLNFFETWPQDRNLDISPEAEIATRLRNSDEDKSFCGLRDYSG